mgnify:CR=1 FL=1
MNLDTEIQTHSEWKTKFRSAMRARGRFDATTVGDDHRCPLGQWLHGAAKEKYGHLECYKVCVAEHSRFHREAGRIAALINDQRYVAAEEAMGMDTAYQQASNAVVAAIMAMKRQMPQG